MLNITETYFDSFIEEWKRIYVPSIWVNNFIDIRPHKISGWEIMSGISHFPNEEPMMCFGTIFSVKFHCEMQDTILKFPFDKHSCNLEVICSHTISVHLQQQFWIRAALCKKSTISKRKIILAKTHAMQGY